MVDALSELSEEEYNFIAAVLEDENAEFPLDSDEEYILFTDWEGDGEFYPSITILHTVDDVDTERDIIDELIDTVDWFEYDEVEGIENDSTGDMAHAYFYNPRIDHDYAEQVQMDL